MPGIQPDRVIGNFRIIRKLGSGGMGEVWLAEQLAMERKVALKILSPSLVNDQDFVNRFMSEVKMTAKLHHHNMITAFDAGNDQGIYYLAMSYVDGIELGDRVKIDKKIPEKEALHIIKSIADALNYAWKKFKILHRDIKPANIMIDSDGQPKLMDMGISKSLSEERGLTMTGAIVGTPHYMSPEQARAEELDCRSDIYSLGATFYHIVTGDVPYDASTAMGIITRHIADPLPPPELKNPEISGPCSALIHIMLAKKREERQEDWDKVIEDIKLVLHGKMPATPLPSSAATEITTTSQAFKQIKCIPTEKPLTPVHLSSLPSSIFSARDQEVKKTGMLSFKNIFVLTIFLVFAGLTAAISFIIVRNRPPPYQETAYKAPEIISQRLDNIENSGSKETESFIKKVRRDSEKASKLLDSMDFSVEDSAESRKEKERKGLEQWELSVSFADKNPLQTELASANFERIMKKYPQTKYAVMAADKIKEIRNKADNLKKEKINAVMDSLNSASADLVKSGEFQKAVAVYLEYKGNLSEETQPLRKEAAQGITDKAALLREEKEKQKAADEIKRNEFFDTYLDYMLKGDYKAAAEHSRISEEDSRFPELRKYAEELLEADRIIINSLANDSGKYIAIEKPEGRKMVKFKKLKGSSVYYEIKIGKGLAQEKIPVRNLAFSEKARRLSGKIQMGASALYSMGYIARSGKPEHILKYTDPLSEPLKAAAGRRIKAANTEKAEAEAELEFTRMLKKAGFKARSVNLREINSFLAEVPYTEEKQNELKKLLSDYSIKFGESLFYGNSKDMIEAFALPDPEIKKAINGKLLYFNKSTCEISVLYEFDNDSELKDWQSMEPFRRRNRPFISEGYLVAGGSGPTAIACKIPFKSLEASFDGILGGDFNELLYGKADCLIFVVAGMGGHNDGYGTVMFPFKPREGQFFRIGPSSLKQGDKLSGTLTWKSGSAYFSCNGKKWKDLSYRQETVKFGIMAFRNENKYNSILIKGIADKEWCEKATSSSETEQEGTEPIDEMDETADDIWREN